MKSFTKQLIATCLVAGITAGAIGQTTDTPAETKDLSPKPVARKSGTKVTVARTGGDTDEKDEAKLTLNFRSAPLETVLTYLSEAAGYTIVLQTTVRGTVDVWNAQPLSKAEALEVLSSALAKNGLSYIQNGRTLTILSQEDAKKRNMPVKQGSKPEEIPQNDEIVTQIMPLSHINAAQLLRDLDTLLPKTADVTSNEGGNAIIITDTQANIRHFAEIVEAIDTSISSIAGIKVFPLKFADSKAVSQVIKDLFAPDTSSSNQRGGGTGSPFGGFTSRFGGGAPGGFGGGAPGGFGGGTPGGGRTSSRNSAATSKVVAVSDDRSNSVVVTAPDDVMPTIEELIKAVDINVEDVTELRVFRLKYADPSEMADLLSNLFPDETKQNNNNGSSQTSRFGSPFGGFFGATGGAPGGGRTGSTGGSSAGGAQSDRAKKQGRVIAVADPRTVSVVVSTSHDLMRQIEQMVTQLDSNKGKNQVVKVYPLDNADAQQVQQVLQELFQSTQSNSRNRNSANQNSALTTRASTQVQSQGTGNTGFGSAGGGGGGGNRGGGNGP